MTIEEKRKKISSHLLQSFRRPSQYMMFLVNRKKEKRSLFIVSGRRLHTVSGCKGGEEEKFTCYVWVGGGEEKDICCVCF